MNILLHLKEINHDYIFFGDSIKNSIIENGIFYRIIYSNTLMSLNSLFISFEMNINSQKEMIEILTELEKVILSKIDTTKHPQYKIKDYLKFLTSKGGEEFKLNKYILKISGIWETETDYGITFKFLDIK